MENVSVKISHCRIDKFTTNSHYINRKWTILAVANECKFSIRYYQNPNILILLYCFSSFLSLCSLCCVVVLLYVCICVKMTKLFLIFWWRVFFWVIVSLFIGIGQYGGSQGTREESGGMRLHVYNIFNFIIAMYQ